MILEEIKTTVLNIPIVGENLQKLYHKTNHYKKRRDAIDRLILSEKQEREFKDGQYIIDVFDNNMVIRSGPFAGMNYIKKSYGSALLPKILGSYEEPIQPWINELSNENYKIIIDLGCAEGYYAVGFAFKKMASKILAIDMNLQALESARELAQINSVESLLEFQCKNITITDLEQLLEGEDLLLFCDIEGTEIVLLDPELVPQLRTVDIILELHDNIVPGVTDIMIARFSKTHKIEISIDYPRKKDNYPFLSDVVDEDTITYIFNERRPPMMRWMRLKALRL